MNQRFRTDLEHDRLALEVYKIFFNAVDRDGGPRFPTVELQLPFFENGHSAGDYDVFAANSILEKSIAVITEVKTKDSPKYRVKAYGQLYRAINGLVNIYDRVVGLYAFPLSNSIQFEHVFTFDASILREKKSFIVPARKEYQLARNKTF